VTKPTGPSSADWQAELGAAAQAANRLLAAADPDTAALADAVLRVTNWAQSHEWATGEGSVTA
jgi:hypothetical protein